jgi:hypothetical protein
MDHSCPYCHRKATSLSVVNRHIKAMAKKPANERGMHPEECSHEYERIARSRRFRSVSKTEDEKHLRRFQVQRRYRIERKMRQEVCKQTRFRMVEDALEQLK